MARTKTRKPAKKVVKRAKDEMLAAARKLQSLVASATHGRAKAKSKGSAAAKTASKATTPRPRPKAKAVASTKSAPRSRRRRPVVALAPVATQTVSTIEPEVGSTEEAESKVA